ncbi:MAG: helix-turn-helix transcriptional regulator [Gammaproteobacteria bacterium]
MQNRIFLMRLPEAARELGIKLSSFYAGVNAGVYPRPFKIGLKASRVPSDEIAAVVAARIAGKNDDQLRALVASLTKARTDSAPADGA